MQTLHSSSSVLHSQHFDYTLVFGQGPVQETERIPRSGDEGLNLFSRLVALSAAEMLKAGITDRVILSGGETGVRAGTPEASTEAELMADIISRHADAYGRGDEYARIIIENEAKDTYENFAYTLNKFIDVDESKQHSIAILGIGFHAKDFVNGTGQGRLEVLAEKLGLQATVYSAEEVLETLVGKRGNDDYIKQELERLTSLDEYSLVSILKSQQERLLIDYLYQGDWVRVLHFLKSEKRSRTIIAQDEYVMNKLAEKFSLSPRDIEDLPYDELLQKVNDLDLEGMKHRGYTDVKHAVFNTLKAMSRNEDVDYFGKYAKGDLKERKK